MLHSALSWRKENARKGVVTYAERLCQKVLSGAAPQLRGIPPARGERGLWSESDGSGFRPALRLWRRHGLRQRLRRADGEPGRAGRPLPQDQARPAGRHQDGQRAPGRRVRKGALRRELRRHQAPALYGGLPLSGRGAARRGRAGSAHRPPERPGAGALHLHADPRADQGGQGPGLPALQGHQQLQLPRHHRQRQAEQRAHAPHHGGGGEVRQRRGGHDHAPDGRNPGRARTSRPSARI